MQSKFIIIILQQQSQVFFLFFSNAPPWLSGWMPFFPFRISGNRGLINWHSFLFGWGIYLILPTACEVITAEYSFNIKAL
jgi:hypothetical protein